MKSFIWKTHDQESPERIYLHGAGKSENLKSFTHIYHIIKSWENLGRTGGEKREKFEKLSLHSVKRNSNWRVEKKLRRKKDKNSREKRFEKINKISSLDSLHPLEGMKFFFIISFWISSRRILDSPVRVRQWKCVNSVSLKIHKNLMRRMQRKQFVFYFFPTYHSISLWHIHLTWQKMKEKLERKSRFFCD